MAQECNSSHSALKEGQEKVFFFGKGIAGYNLTKNAHNKVFFFKRKRLLLIMTS